VGIALVLAILVISLGVHEAAHGWVALKCGDTTARDLGRITLNPMAHIDPFMTVILPLMMYYAVGFPFGGAKPVPVNFHNLRRPYRDMALVALAGPFSNFLIAVFFGFVLKIVVALPDPSPPIWLELGIWPPDSLGAAVLAWAMYLNLLLAAFNLLPIPPLDGSRIMAWLLPEGLREAYHKLERFGLLLVMVLIFMVPGTQRLIWTTIMAMESVVGKITTLGGLW
jgi:Zn-dependent protease